MFRRAKTLVGLDIGSSAVKAVELKAVRQDLQGHRLRRRVRSPRQHRRRRDHRRRGGGGCDPAAVREPQDPDERRRRVPVGQRRDRQEDHAAGDDRGGARRIHLLGGRAVHPLRHPGREPRLPDPRRRRRAGGEVHHGRPAGRREEGKDRRLHRRDRAGRAQRRGRRRRRLRAAERLRSELRHRAGAGRGAAQCRGERHQHQHPPGRSVGLHPRHLDRRQRLHRGAAEGAEPARTSRPTS